MRAGRPNSFERHRLGEPVMWLAYEKIANKPEAVRMSG
jgi:hypothetical protein